jgi:hypothetical protein
MSDNAIAYKRATWDAAGSDNPRPVALDLFGN